MLLLRSTFSLFSNIPSITYQGLATTQHYIYKSSHNIRVNFTSMAEQHLYVASHVRRLGYCQQRQKSYKKTGSHKQPEISNGHSFSDMMSKCTQTKQCSASMYEGGFVEPLC